MSNRKLSEQPYFRYVVGTAAVAIAGIAYWYVGTIEKSVTNRNEAAWIREFGHEYIGFRGHLEQREDHERWSNLLDEKNRAPANYDQDCDTAIRNGDFGKFVAKGIKSVSNPEDIFGAAEQMKAYLKSCSREDPPKCLSHFDTRSAYFGPSQASTVRPLRASPAG